MNNNHKRPGVRSATREWMNDPSQTSADKLLAFEMGYQRGYDKGREPKIHQDFDGALDELLSSDIAGLSHAAVDFSVKEDGSFRSHDYITLYVVDGWCDASKREVEDICDRYGCECRVE